MPGVSIFKDVPLVPTDHVFHVNQQYKDDTNPNKVNLGIGGKVSLYFCGKSGLKFWPSRVWSDWVCTRDLESLFTVVYWSLLGRRFLGCRLLGRLFLGRRLLGCRFPGRRFMGRTRRSSFSRSSFSRHPWYNGRGQPHKFIFLPFSPAILAYRDDDGNPMVLSVVSRVEKQLAEEIAAKTLNHEYLSIDGLGSFTQAACKLCLGGDSPAIAENRVRYIFISSSCVNSDSL